MPPRDRSSGPSLPRRRSRWRGARYAALFALTITLGCHGDGGGPVGPSPAIGGHWSGDAASYTVHFEATFTQAGQAVGGTGHFSSPLASGDFTVSGTLVGVQVDLVLTSEELGATAFRGRFTAADRIEGTFDPGGANELDLTLDRD